MPANGGRATKDMVGDSFGSAMQLENHGSVASQSGILVWNSLAPPSSPAAPYTGVSDGSFSGTGNGKVELWGIITVNTQTVMWGGAVWVDGTLQGTVVVPSGQT